MKILIKNGLIVNADFSTNGNILIENGKILKTGNFDFEACEDMEVIDAEGKLIFPGGIDPHVHLNLKTAAGISADDFLSGSMAALHGGTTTIIDFITPEAGENLVTATEKRLAEAATSMINVKLHLSPIHWDENTENEMRECARLFGITSFKCYMAYKNSIGLNDSDLLKVMKVVGKLDGVLALHCEDGDEIETLRNHFSTRNLPPAKAHYLSRPPETESAAVAKAIQMAEKANCKIYIVHTSSALSLPHVYAAQSKGQPVFAETCPQYLLLEKSKYDLDDEKAAAFVMSPPLRSPEDNASLWKAAAAGVISTIGTDHCPFTFSQKMAGIKDFRKIPNGAGGVEHRLELLYTYGVLENKITLNKFVGLTSTNAAKIFGLYPAKGIIAPGADADIVIWNPKSAGTISPKSHHSKSDISVYEGFNISGNAQHVICNGKTMIKDETLLIG